MYYSTPVRLNVSGVLRTLGAFLAVSAAALPLHAQILSPDNIVDNPVMWLHTASSNYSSGTWANSSGAASGAVSSTASGYVAPHSDHGYFTLQRSIRRADL